MTTYKKTLIIEDPQQLVLRDLPFKAGQKVRVIILTESSEQSQITPPYNEGDGTDRWSEQGEKLRALLKDTQALPSSQAITEEEIAAEIDAVRQGK
ncbi:MAG: hypothetical protein AAFO04_26105 [Cyanobacteria bacterium J06592_8]